MLDTSSPSFSSYPVRNGRRGAQPGNRNAFKHGLYSARVPSPLASLSSSIRSARQLPDKSPRSYHHAIQHLQELLCLVLEFQARAQASPQALALDKLSLKALRAVVRLKHARLRQELPAHDLHSASQHALDLIRLVIADLGISRDAGSFREKDENSDFYFPFFQDPARPSLTGPSSPFLSPRQWRLLEPLLPPPGPSRRRGRPPVDPRELLDAAFWKLAHKARWQDLPEHYPSMFSCRHYYRRLFLSGRLTTLYAALYQDLLTRGQADLTQFVQQGSFSITGTRLSLRPDLDETWQMRTSLLFLQLGYRDLRRLERELKFLRRFGYTSFRNLVTGCRLFSSAPNDQLSCIPVVHANPYSLSPGFPLPTRLHRPLKKPGSHGSLRRSGSPAGLSKRFRSANSAKKVTFIPPYPPGLEGTSPVSNAAVARQVFRRAGRICARRKKRHNTGTRSRTCLADI